MRTLLIALLILVGAPLAHADGGAQAAMQTYFDGEIRGGYVLAGMGVAGLAAGGFLYRNGSLTARGASYPLLGLGLAHLAAGVYVGLASGQRIDQFSEQIAADAPAFVAREEPRMKGVSRTFTALKLVEVAVIAGGLGAAAYGARSDRPRLKGAGLALAVEAALTLGFDVVAARRASTYRDALAATHVAIGHDAEAGATVATLAYGARF